jgi:hypothetical protein
MGEIFMKVLVLGLSLILALHCASTEPKETEEDGGFLNSLVEKAQSEEGQKAIQTAKEKLEEKET